MTSPGPIDAVPTPEPPGRAFRPREGLPTGRAVVGALLVTIAALGAFAFASQDHRGPIDGFLVLTDDVEAGETIALTDVAFAVMDVPPEVAANAVRNDDGVEGATALRLLRTGEVLDGRAISAAPVVDGEAIDPAHELTFPVRRNRAPAHLRRGDRVTVLAHHDGMLVTALEDALVLSYDTGGPSVLSASEGVLTVALPDSELVSRGALLSYDDEDLTVALTTRALDDVFAEDYALTLTSAETEHAG